MLALWSGLGYYSRARNLRRAAQADRGGAAASRATTRRIRALPGIGDYTAAAVAQHRVRAAARGAGRQRAARGGAGGERCGRYRVARARASAFARSRRSGWIRASPGHFNQALMELGATVCLPRNPLCLVCPLRDCCRRAAGGHGGATAGEAAQDGAGAKLTAVLLVVRQRGRILLRQRAARRRRMAGFWDLPAPEELPQRESGSASARSGTPSRITTTRWKCAPPLSRTAERGRLPLVRDRTTCGDSLQHHGAQSAATGGNRLQVVIVS